jgi:hypothetical protein
MDDCSFKGVSSLHPNDISEAIHMHQTHDNVPLEVAGSVIMFFSMQLPVKSENVCIITLTDGNGQLFLPRWVRITS